MTHEELKVKAFSNENVRTEYDALVPEFILLKEMLLARQHSGLNNKEIAERMGLTELAITRLESALISGNHLPSLAVIKKYAEALNCHVEVKLVHNG